MAGSPSSEQPTAPCGGRLGGGARWASFWDDVWRKWRQELGWRPCLVVTVTSNGDGHGVANLLGGIVVLMPHPSRTDRCRGIPWSCLIRRWHCLGVCIPPGGLRFGAGYWQAGPAKDSGVLASRLLWQWWWQERCRRHNNGWDSRLFPGVFARLHGFVLCCEVEAAMVESLDPWRTITGSKWPV